MVKQLTQNTDHYRQMSEAAFHHVQTHLSWQAWAQGLGTLVRDTLHKARLDTAA